MSRIIRRIREIAASEHGGCSPFPVELATGCLGIVVMIGAMVLLGTFFVWCLS